MSVEEIYGYVESQLRTCTRQEQRDFVFKLLEHLIGSETDKVTAIYRPDNEAYGFFVPAKKWVSMSGGASRKTESVGADTNRSELRQTFKR